MKMPLILTADDDSNMLELLAYHLKKNGFRVESASDGSKAKKQIREEIDLALFDLQMPYASGIECLKHVKKHFPETPVIVLSAYGKIKDAVEAMKYGAFWYLEKPFEPEQLISLVKQAIHHASLTRENRELKQALGTPMMPVNLVAESASMKGVLDKIKKVSALDTTVLITGPSGTGKTAVARLIHQSGPRSSFPFISLSCAAVPRDLLESELFGHERGAFTGAVSSRPGSAEMADGGTLFLDEVGDMPLDLQPKLLTFLQDRMVRRVGSNTEKRVSTRIIAATHQDLQKMCREKKFREDLYFRLNVLPVELPPLKERKADIEPLVRQCLESIASQRGVSGFTISNEALQRLKAYAWPGNVRELENVLERASAFCEGSHIEISDLTLEGTPDSEDAPSQTSSLAGLTIKELERRAIADALRACNGNKTAAAKMLGISEKSIYNKMKRLEIR